ISGKDESMRFPCVVILACVGLLPAARAQSKAAALSKDSPADWPMYTRDLAGTRYSPLTGINAANVSKLVTAWTYRLRPSTAPAEPPPAPGQGAGRGGAGASPTTNPEATPIVINGVMYLPAATRVLALDAETGKEIWTAPLRTSTTARGVAYWPGDADNPPRIILTAGPTLVALNAATGKLDPGFGNEGVVNITVPWNGVPAIFQNIVMLGATVGEILHGEPGDSRAFDARTGAKLWEFHSIPRPGEPGFGSWAGDTWKGFSGTNVWGWYLTVDEQRGIVYMPFGSPAGNYYGGDRPGNNLFGNSIVAVDAKTGKYLWHFQTVHHDLWDADLPPAPGLVDIVQNGRTIPALAQIGKKGWMFILNRVTGEPIFGVEERPVPKGDVPGEWYSPTEPFPLKPPPLARMTFRKEDMVTADDTSPEHAKACQEFWERSGGFYNEGPFTPFLYHEAGTPPRSTLIFPGNGGANWGGTATDPKTGYVYVQTHDVALVGWVEKKVEGGNYGSGNGSPQLYDRGSVDGPGPYHTFSAAVKDANGHTIGTWPCQKPPWGRLFAVNANTGDIAWQVPLGITEAFAPGKQNTGGSGSAGPIVTAGGLVFIGATNDNRFRAFDSKTGKELWVTKLERAANANPMTYQGKNGKQYVAVIATDTVDVFALP
ncbi:MAG TPA: PQQ-binding-like beta-propeller repeat protein, partial [Bryobacteraceae bacterium]|nr:PQQ-binding-like beta-propeller repeat protein [Bryobacteraceae bacterium]